MARRRRLRPDVAGRAVVLYPAVAEACRRIGADAVGLVSVGCGAGLDLTIDRVGISYSSGLVLGDPSSAVQVSARVVGGRPVPGWSLPPVVARIGVDVDRLDVTEADDVRELRAGLDQPGRLDAELALLARDPPVLLAGDLVGLLGAAISRVPAGALPVVTTTWALAALAPARRPEFLVQLARAAVGRPVAWVSVEGVGVAPGVPTLGDRHGSGHSIIGLTVLDRSGRSAEVLGRCWSRGQVLSWLVRPEPPGGGGRPPR